MKKILEWDGRYSVNDRRLDRQHRRILRVINDLYNLGAQDTQSGRLLRIFIRLQNYILNHFRTEEAWMQSINYPELEEHRNEHKRFVDEVCSYHRTFLKGEPIVAINLFNYLWDWFARHVLSYDKKYDTFVEHQRKSG